MSTGVKICGLKTPETLEAAITAGATHFGMVFFAASPRHISLDDAASLSHTARGRIVSVALVVNAADQEIERIVSAVNPDMIQLHGAEAPERASQIRKSFGKSVIKAISVGKPGDAERAFAYREAADLILFDAKPPKKRENGLPGGNGLPFDWRLLTPIRDKIPFMLSGGLNPGNVAEALRLTGAPIVDVSSGVETAPGEKDIGLIRQFVSAVRQSALKEIANG